MRKGSAFDAIISEVMSELGSSEMLEESMSFDADRVSKVPLRYRIIALGFVRGYSLDELNEKLTSSGCARLYARSLWEASLMYAFMHRLSYTEWQRLQDICTSFRDSREVEDRYFRSSSITMKELAEYLHANSEETPGMETRHLTRLVELRLSESTSDEDAFHEFLLQNVEAFTPVREKTRYYFCKYLYYMLTARIERYAASIKDGAGSDDALAELVVFKGITPLKRKKMNPEEARAFLMEAGLSCGEIFDAFNYFFFEYISLDWMQVLLEYFGNIDSLPANERHMLAEYLREYDSVSYGKLNDDEALNTLTQKMETDESELDQIYSLEGTSRGYQRNRSGENTIRKYIKGTLDIDRTTLICFLLFLGSEADEAALDAHDLITEKRLNEILLECGFPTLREDDDFDSFVLRFLSSDDPVSCLMEEVTSYAMMEENFYLYRVYQASTSYNEEFERLTK